MNFKIVNSVYEVAADDDVYLVNNDWDDWFEFETVYIVYYKKEYVGRIRIGREGQTERRAELVSPFVELPRDYFSLGVSVDYYKCLKGFQEKRAEILTALHDMAYDLSRFNMYKNERVTQISLLRDFTEKTVLGQFHRIADGGAELTNYDFKYIMSDENLLTGEKNSISFIVDAANKYPASNIHVLIGNNGIGKTTVIKGMLNALLGISDKYGKIETGWGEEFANIVNISFSAFDDPICKADVKNSTVPYTYIGLIEARIENGERKKYVQYNELINIFLNHYHHIIKSVTKKEIWNRVIKTLENDTTFRDLDITNWCEDDRYFIKKIGNELQREKTETEVQWKQRVYHEYLRRTAGERFLKLSSGHKNILLTMVGLVDHVEEKTLVIMDEPEEHLHPPLVSAFIRALSDLLQYRNGVAIIATHSPVIVQEVPKKCVWIINRTGYYRSFIRPNIETFGENIGEITTEVFSYDLEHSGFHSMLKEVSEKTHTYQRALSEFNGELGNEAKSILRAYMYDREVSR